jgi:hypothetical protein
MSMTRTQIYLTESQKRILRHIAAERDSNVSDLVREAVDRLIASDGVDWGARFDAFREKIEAGPEFSEEDFEAADTEVKATRKRLRAATA